MGDAPRSRRVTRNAMKVVEKPRTPEDVEEPVEEEDDDSRQTLLSFLNQYQDLMGCTADIFKDDVSVIKVHKIDRNLRTLEKEKTPEAIRLSKSIVVGFQDAVAKTVKDLNLLATTMAEDLQKRFNLPADWNQSPSIFGSMTGSEVMGPTFRNSEMHSRISSFINESRVEDVESLGSSSKGKEANGETRLEDAVITEAEDGESEDAPPAALPLPKDDATVILTNSKSKVAENEESTAVVPASDEDIEDEEEVTSAAELSPAKFITPSTSAKPVTPTKPSKNDSALKIKRERGHDQDQPSSQFETPKKKDSPETKSSEKKTPRSSVKRERVQPMETDDPDSDSSGKTCVLPVKSNKSLNFSKPTEPIRLKKEHRALSESQSESKEAGERESPSRTPKKADSKRLNIKKEIVESQKKATKEAEENNAEIADNEETDPVPPAADDHNDNDDSIMDFLIPPAADDHNDNDDSFMDFLAPPSPMSTSPIEDTGFPDNDDTGTVVLGTNAGTTAFSRIQTENSSRVNKGIEEQSAPKSNSSGEAKADKKIDIKNPKDKEKLTDQEIENRKDKMQQSKADRDLIKDVLGSGSDSDSSPKKKPSLSRRRNVSKEGKEDTVKGTDNSEKRGAASQDTAYNPKDDPKLKDVSLVTVNIARFDQAIERSLNENGFIRLKDFDGFKKMSCQDLENKDESSDSDSSMRSDDSTGALKKLIKDLTRSSVLCTKKYNKKKGKEGSRSSKKKSSKRSKHGEELDSDTDSDDDDDGLKKSSNRSPLKGGHNTILSDSGSEDLSDRSNSSKKEKSKSKPQSKDSGRGKRHKSYKTVTLSSDESEDNAMRDVLGSDSDSDGKKRRSRPRRVKKEKASDSGTDSDFVSSKNSKKREAKDKNKKKADSDSDISILSVDSDNSDSDFKSGRKRSKRRRDSSPEDGKKSKKKRRRIIVKDSSGSSDSDDIQEIPQEPKPDDSEDAGTRKKIRNIMKSKHLARTTKEAERDEEERRKRLADRQKLFNGIHKAPESDKLERLVLDEDPETNEPLVEVDKSIVRHLKPHQAEGIKFMYNACFESVEMIKQDKVPGGCILAHCMGLGKTLQSVAFMHTMLTNKLSGIKTALVICPLSTVTNWFNETKSWTEEAQQQVKMHKLYEMKSTVASRLDYLKVWQRRGGVGILHYDMFRRLADPKGTAKMKESLRTAIKEALLDPGPDMVICDEGHLLKNCKSILSLAVNNIRTHRRIVLTGTPLQNNLVEYHTMMNFVKPNLLGSLPEFTNRFVNPIKNGQHADSTDYDVKTMKRRAHVLHRKLEGCVQRCDYSILAPYLPPKYEYIINIKLSEKQEQLYKLYLGNVVDSNPDVKRKNLLRYYAELVKVWSHPIALTMRKVSNDDEEETTDDANSLEDFIVDGSTEEESEEGNSDGVAKKSKRRTRATAANDPDPDANNGNGLDDCMFGGKWWNTIFKSKSEMYDVELSGKLIILQEILKTCEAIGDRVLVFSQFLTSLNIIEEFLAEWDEVGQKEAAKVGDLTFPLTETKNVGRWRKNIEYFRIDGQTKVSDRHRDCEKFNKKSALSRAKLFLISTRAGGLGINLYGANRVVIFDASWNPSQDMQSIFRVYRFGQDKPCYIYRLIARGTMEEKILRRQITKLSLSSRVVDEHQIQRHFKFDDVNEMYRYDEEDPATSDAVLAVPRDRLLADLLMSHREWIRSYEQFDSLLENKEDEGLTKEEKELAWAEYRIESDRQKHTQASTSSSMQAETYVKVKPRLQEKYPTATEEQLEEATRISLQVINKIREGMLILNQPGWTDNHPGKQMVSNFIEPLKVWLAQTIQVSAGQTGDIEEDLIKKPLPLQFYQQMPRLAPSQYQYPGYPQQQFQQQQNIRPPSIRRPNRVLPANYQLPIHNIQNNFQNIVSNAMPGARQAMYNNSNLIQMHLDKLAAANRQNRQP